METLCVQFTQEFTMNNYFTATTLDPEEITGPAFKTWEEADAYARNRWPDDSYQVDEWTGNGKHVATRAVLRAKAVSNG
jgi:hypothetical protein